MEKKRNNMEVQEPTPEETKQDVEEIISILYYKLHKTQALLYGTTSYLLTETNAIQETLDFMMQDATITAIPSDKLRYVMKTTSLYLKAMHLMTMLTATLKEITVKHETLKENSPLLEAMISEQPGIISLSKQIIPSREKTLTIKEKGSTGLGHLITGSL